MKPKMKKNKILYARISDKNFEYLDKITTKLYGNGKYKRSIFIDNVLEELRTKGKSIIEC